MKDSVKTYAQTWHRALKGSPVKDWPALSQAMLRMIVLAGQARSLPAIVNMVKRLEHPNRLDVTVTSAHQADEKTVEKLLAELLGKADASVTYKVDPSLVGGLVVQTADQRWDLSVRKQLSRLHHDISGS